jgi:hypothetical protein
VAGVIARKDCSDNAVIPQAASATMSVFSSLGGSKTTVQEEHMQSSNSTTSERSVLLRSSSHELPLLRIPPSDTGVTAHLSDGDGSYGSPRRHSYDSAIGRLNQSPGSEATNIGHRSENGKSSSSITHGT